MFKYLVSHPIFKSKIGLLNGDIFEQTLLCLLVAVAYAAPAAEQDDLTPAAGYLGLYGGYGGYGGFGGYGGGYGGYGLGYGGYGGYGGFYGR